jgi:uncharacterized protein YjiS (DUF1127 family)
LKDYDMTMLSNMPRYSATAQIRSNVGSSLVWLGRLVNRLVAVALARYARHAQLAALRQLSDRELKDIGIYRGEIDRGLDEAAKTRARLQWLDR